MKKTTATASSETTTYSSAWKALRRLIAQAEARHPEAKIGLTGLPVMENDEMRSSQAAMMKASLLSLFGVACLFVAGFGGLRHPLLTVAALLPGAFGAGHSRSLPRGLVSAGL